MRKERKQKPLDFIGIGAQKSGTSWLFYQLSQLEEFNLPPFKEFHYFDRSANYLSPNFLAETRFKDRIKQYKYFPNAIREIYSRTKHFTGWKSASFYIRWYFADYSDQWYLSLFKELEGYTGEITPSYSILNEEDIQRIYQLVPNVKLVLMLRNPVDRAWSQFRHNVKRKRLDKSSAEHDIRTFLQSDAQVLRSNYLRTIDNFSKVFPKQQLLIGFYDAITDAPNQLLSDIASFITDKKVVVSLKSSSLEREVNKSPLIDCPESIKHFLTEKYYEQIQQLSTRYGSYCSKWLRDLYEEETQYKNIRLRPTIHLP
ncbi:MAG: sulfotransferase domain-containing protein [Bacteroidota bacterium]